MQRLNCPRGFPASVAEYSPTTAAFRRFFGEVTSELASFATLSLGPRVASGAGIPVMTVNRQGNFMVTEERIDVEAVVQPVMSIGTPVSISLDDRLRELERTLITWALKATRGNKSRAAALLQIKRSTLGDRIRHCGLGPVAPASVYDTDAMATKRSR
jgi:hypothetical protein